MSTSINELLERAGLPARMLPHPMTRTVVVRNHRAVPPLPGARRDEVMVGFHLVLLDEDLRPTHYVRCYPASERGFERECGISIALGGDAALRRVVPQYFTAAAGEVRVLVSEYLSGIDHGRNSARRLPGAGAAQLIDIFDARDLLCSRATSLLEPPDETRTVSLREDSKGSFEVLRARCPALDLGRCEQELAQAGPLRAELQHGDFWSHNVICVRDGYRIIDYEEFAKVHVPLYDLFHFMQSYARLGSYSSDVQWLGRTAPRRMRAYRREWQRIIEGSARRFALSGEDIGRCLLFYLVRYTAYRLRAGVPWVYAAPLVHDVEVAVDALARGARPMELLAWL